jgi:hypothetical protein
VRCAIVQKPPVPERAFSGLAVVSRRHPEQDLWQIRVHPALAPFMRATTDKIQVPDTEVIQQDFGHTFWNLNIENGLGGRSALRA